MAYYIESLQNLAEQFAKLPGVGRKSAMRMAYAALNMTDEAAKSFVDAIEDAREKIHYCPICQNLTDREICPICSDLSRDTSVICVVEDPKDVMSIEKVREYRGTYHVLHGVISPVKGVTPDKIRLRELIERVGAGDEVREIIVATNPTVEGEATAMYIAKLVRPLGIKVTRLAYGMPVGGNLEYADEVTLFRAIEGRRDFQ
ncbi:MAG: recombination protein RecR [Ruminococcaceae bacterium]|nr:recombination protein RecR [Oscillospiraceae bacterium]